MHTKKQARLIKSLNKTLKSLCELVDLPANNHELARAKSYEYDHEYAYCTVEDGKRYTYPELIHVTISARSDFKFSYRVKDGRWIMEGRSLTGKGLKRFQVINLVKQDLMEWPEVILKANKPKAEVYDLFTGNRVA